jgi:hypothetical protein
LQSRTGLMAAPKQVHWELVSSSSFISHMAYGGKERGVCVCACVCVWGVMMSKLGWDKLMYISPRDGQQRSVGKPEGT